MKNLDGHFKKERGHESMQSICQTKSPIYMIKWLKEQLIQSTHAKEISQQS